MTKRIKSILSTLLASLLFFSATAETVVAISTTELSDVAITEDKFTDIEPVLIGSGGYITGLVIHPSDPDIMYIRTDVGGAYRWEEKTNSWTQLMSSFSLDGQYAVDGIALDKNNKDIVYICVGNDQPWEQGVSSGIWKSEDRGNTWTDISPDYTIRFHGNSENRGDGECIAVDPNNSNILWVGTRSMEGYRDEEYEAGLHYSTDGGQTWTKKKLYGDRGTLEEVRCIFYDPNSLNEGKSQTIYAVVNIVENNVNIGGLYRSTNAGETWDKVEGLPSAAYYHEAKLDAEGRVLITFGESRTTNASASVSKGVYRLNVDGTWENFGINIPENGYTTYFALETDKNDPDRVIVGVGSGVVNGQANTWRPPIYYTSDGGATWTDVTPINTRKMAGGWKGYSHSMGAVAALTFGEGDSLWMTDWSEVYYTACVSAGTDSARSWRTYIKNIEELVTFSALSVPNGSNLFMAADTKNAFVINDDEVDTYPSYLVSSANYGTFQQADYSADNPNFVVGAYSSQNVIVGNVSDRSGYVYVSENGGESWRNIQPSITYTDENGNSVEEWLHPGDIAVSANDTNKLVMVTLENKIYYSSDKGVTWNLSGGTLPSTFIPGNMWHGSSPLESDKNSGNIFYLMDSTGLYKSTDYGASWSLSSSVPTMDSKENGVRVLTYENAPGDVWVSSASGVCYSDDYGVNFNKIGSLNSGNITLGKSKTGNDYVLYFCGIIGENNPAIYYSEDKGQSFIRLTNYNEYTLAKTNTVYASKNQYGRVYIGSGGLGWSYLDIPLETYNIADEIRTEVSSVDFGGSTYVAVGTSFADYELAEFNLDSINANTTVVSKTLQEIEVNGGEYIFRPNKKNTGTESWEKNWYNNPYLAVQDSPTTSSGLIFATKIWSESYAPSATFTFTAPKDGVYTIVPKIAYSGKEGSVYNDTKREAIITIKANGKEVSSSIAAKSSGSIPDLGKIELNSGDTIEFIIAMQVNVLANEGTVTKLYTDFNINLIKDLTPIKTYSVADEFANGISALLGENDSLTYETAPNANTVNFGTMQYHPYNYPEYKRVITSISKSNFRINGYRNNEHLIVHPSWSSGNYRGLQMGALAQEEQKIVFTAPKTGIYDLVPLSTTADMLVASFNNTSGKDITLNISVASVNVHTSTVAAGTTGDIPNIENIKMKAGETIELKFVGAYENKTWYINFKVELMEDLTPIETYNMADEMREYLASLNYSGGTTLTPSDRAYANYPFGNYKINTLFRTNTSFTQIEKSSSEYTIVGLTSYNKPGVAVAADSATYDGIRLLGVYYEQTYIFDFIAPKDGIYTISDAVSYSGKQSLFNQNFTNGMKLKVLVNGVAQNISEESDRTFLTIGNNQTVNLPDIKKITLNAGDVVQFSLVMPQSEWNQRNAYINFDINLIKDLTPITSWNVRNEISDTLVSMKEAGTLESMVGKNIFAVDFGLVNIYQSYNGKIDSVNSNAISTALCNHNAVQITTYGVKMHVEYNNQYELRFTAPQNGSYKISPRYINSGETANIYFTSPDSGTAFSITAGGITLPIGPNGETEINTTNLLTNGASGGLILRETTVELYEGQTVIIGTKTGSSWNNYVEFDFDIELVG